MASAGACTPTCTAACGARAAASPSASADQTGRHIALPAGASVVDLTTHIDERGSFTEVFREQWVPGVPPMVQSNLSRTRAGGLRGLHFHRQQADYWCVLQGVAFVALVDLRAGSPTQDAAWWHTFDAASGLRGLYVPAGVAHGFLAVDDLTMQYLVDRAFTGEDEFGLAWNDPDLAIPWPRDDPVVSERDKTNASFADVVRDRPSFAG